MTQLTEYYFRDRKTTHHEWIKKFYTQIKIWYRNSVTRRQLKQIPDYLLKDIGIDIDEAHKEVNKAFWR